MPYYTGFEITCLLGRFCRCRISPKHALSGGTHPELLALERARTRYFHHRRIARHFPPSPTVEGVCVSLCVSRQGLEPNTRKIGQKRNERKTLLGIGNRYDNNLQFDVVERIRRYGSYYLAGYVSVVRLNSRFDSSSRHCLVDRACGSTRWTPHGTVLATGDHSR